MSEADLLNTAQSCGQAVSSDFAQVITINFAMVVANYYFLHRAGWGMKVLAFTIYTFGMLTYLGMMIMESEVSLGTYKALRALPESAQSLPTQYLLGIHASWVGITSSILLNVVYWVLWFGIAYLTFLWRKPAELS